ncbi:MAG: glycosyltransferase, partial [Pseudomonadota bacterium]
MRVGLQTWGSEGDVRPFLALGAALADRGHEVRLVVTEIDDRDYGRYADQLGIDIRMVASPVLDSDDELTAAGEALLAMGNAFRQGRYISQRLFEPGVPEMFSAARDLAAWSDVLVRHYFHHPAALAAELERIPQASLSFSPDAIPSADQPPGDLRDFGAWSNRLLWSLAGWALDRTFLPPMNALREQAGLTRLPDTMSGWYAPDLNIVAVSASLRPPSRDWGDMHRVAGFLNLPDSQRFDPLPVFVDEFVDAGDPPVFVGFGSLTPKDPEHVFETLDVVEAGVRRAGCRAIVQGLAEPGTGSPSILHVGRVPHSSLFPRCAAIVHHAG